jgi:hypothetical protein
MNKTKYTFKLCLLVHNRFELAKLALSSLLNQSYTDYEVYVSDNSDDLLFFNYVNDNLNEYPNLKYIYRNKNLPGIQHINTVFDESMDYDFIMIFHDDDILHHDFLDNIIKLDEIDDHNLAAIAVNSFVINDKLSTNQKITYYNQNRKVYSKTDLVDSYFCYDSKGVPPFPGYLYRTSKLKNIRVHKEKGGKHSDLTFLIDILENGYFLWLRKPLMSYRIHMNNDSKAYSEKDRKSLYSYLNNNYLLSKNAKTDFGLLILKEKYNNKLISKYYYYYSLFKYLLRSIFEKRFFQIINVKIEKCINI